MFCLKSETIKILIDKRYIFISGFVYLPMRIYILKNRFSSKSFCKVFLIVTIYNVSYHYTCLWLYRYISIDSIPITVLPTVRNNFELLIINSYNGNIVINLKNQYTL